MVSGYIQRGEIPCHPVGATPRQRTLNVGTHAMRPKPANCPARVGRGDLEEVLLGALALYVLGAQAPSCSGGLVVTLHLADALHASLH